MNTALKAPAVTTASAKAKVDPQPITTHTSKDGCQQAPLPSGMNRWVPREVPTGTASRHPSHAPPAPRQPVTITGEQADRLHNMTLGMALMIRNTQNRPLMRQEVDAIQAELLWALDFFNNHATTAQEKSHGY